MAQSKSDEVASTQAKLPLPEQPPTASDWQSADERKVQSSADGGGNARPGTDAAAQAGLRGPATVPSNVDMSGIGRSPDQASNKEEA